MSIKINDLESFNYLNSVSDNIRNLSDAEISQVSGAGFSSFTITDILRSDGTRFTEEITRNDTSTIIKTTILNADGSGSVRIIE